MKKILFTSSLIFLSLMLLVSGCTKGDPLGMVGVNPKTTDGTPQKQQAIEIPTNDTTTQAGSGTEVVEPTPEEKTAEPPPKLQVDGADRVAGFVDFSGLWRVSQNWQTKTTCEGALNGRGPICARNAATPMDWMQLEAVSTNVTITDNNQKLIVVQYTGEYHHGHSFYQAVKGQSYTYNIMAAWTDYVYELKGTATYNLKQGFIDFSLGGEIQGTPLYSHPSKIGISGEDEGFGVFTSSDIYETYQKYEQAVIPENGEYHFRFIYLETHKGSEGDAPADMHTSNDSQRNVNYIDQPIYWRYMVHETNPLNVNGTIAGVAKAKSALTIEKGTAQLVDNDGTLLGTSPITNGDFHFYNVPVFEQDESGRLERKKYTVKIVHAEANADPVTFGSDVIYWKPGEVTGVDVPGNIEVKLDAMPEIGIKKNLISILSELGKTNYADIEKDAEEWIDSLTEGEISDQELEKIRRGIWAERVIREGAESANAALGQLLDMTANLFAELWGDGFSSASQKLRVSRKFQADRDALLSHQKEHGIPSTAKLFGVEPDQLGSLTGKLDKRARTADQADQYSFWQLFIKQLRIQLVKAFSAAGMDTQTADKVSDWAVLGIRSYLNYYAAGATKSGAASLAIKSSINYTIKQLQPIIFDNRIELDIPIVGGKFKWDTDLVNAFPSYTYVTKDILTTAVEKMKSWNKPADSDQYYKDSMATKEILDTLIKDYTNTAQWGHYLKALTDTSDVSSDVLGLIGKLGIKQFTVASEIMGKAKYLFNTAAIVVPAKFFFWDAPQLTTAGVYKAYGYDMDTDIFQLPPIHDYVDRYLEEPSSLGSDDHYASITPGQTTNYQLLTALTPAVSPGIFNFDSSIVSGISESYHQPVSALLQSLQDNDMGQAIDAGFGDAPDAYENAFPGVRDAVSLLLDQLSSIAVGSYPGKTNEDISDATVAWLEWKAEESAWDTRLWEFCNRIIMSEFEGPDDPYYLIERNRLVYLGQSLLESFDEILGSLDTVLGKVSDTAILPTVSIRLSNPESTSTGESYITQTSEDFTVRAYITNISGIDISDISTLLSVTSQNPSISIVGDPEIIVGNGTLAAYDGSNGSGDDEAVVEWTIRYNGNLEEEYVVLSAYLLENEGLPNSFLANESQQMLFIDPLLYDEEEPVTTTPILQEEPSVVVDTTEITLTADNPMATVLVSNSGAGDLYWTAGSLNDSLVITEPEPGRVSDGHVLIISLPPGFIFEFNDTLETIVRVIDAYGTDTDYQEITVKVSPE